MIVGHRLALLLALCCMLGPLSAFEQQSTDRTAAELMDKAEALRFALEDELTKLQERHQKRAQRVDVFRSLFQEGLVSRLELSQAEAERASDGETIDRREAELTRVADLIAEIRALSSSSSSDEPVMELFPGRATWSLDEVTSLAVFFERSFGRPLPVSARGQTEIHSSLGLDHRAGLDLALHPGSPEGKAMMTYLRELDIPFIAFGRAVKGGATGAHIHVGPQSARMK